MEIRLLGSVEVWADDAPVSVGGSKPRALLAALALNPGHVVSVSRLVDVVWGAEAPATATDLVQTYVSSLRRKLPGGGAVIETRPPGYVLRADPDVIDHVRFQRLVAEARAERARGETANAATLFATALALWRGPALGGAAGPALAAEAARLDESRLAVLEERAAVGLALGAYETLVHDLTSTVREHPAREALRRHLMVALYALDRQADALAVCREGRQFLVDEHGVEPGPALQEAHEAILRSAPTVLGLPERSAEPAGAPAPAARTSGLTPGSRPAQLPSAPPDFTGRCHQLQLVTKGLSAEAAASAVPIWVISGQGGIASQPSRCGPRTSWPPPIRTGSSTPSCTAPPNRRPPRRRSSRGSSRLLATRGRAFRPQWKNRPSCTDRCWPDGGCRSFSTTPRPRTRCARCSPVRRDAPCWSPPATGWPGCRRPPHRA